MEALFYEKGPKGSLNCRLCAHRCSIPPGKSGICGVRINNEGILVSMVYGRPIAEHVDPVEKKPLFHFLPGTISYSIATVGCNFRCDFCQNSEIAQITHGRKGSIAGGFKNPEDIVRSALRHRCSSISYTYTEPTVYFEFAFDIARIAHKKGLKNIFVTNGYMSAEAIAAIAPYLDAANVDLKSFENDFYKKYCKASLDPVLESLKELKKNNIFLEVTTLIIPGLNDDSEMLYSLARFLVENLGPDTPWHVSRFHPHNRMTNIPPTPAETLVRTREIGIEAGLKYVYTGNLFGDRGENTFCYSCGRLLIDRKGFGILRYNLVDGRCPDCGEEVTGIGM